MLKVKVPILEVTENDVIANLQGNPATNIITELACKSAVENYKVGEAIIVVIGQIPVGSLVGLVYDEEKKALVAEIELYIDFVATCGIFKHLETPQGKRIVNLKVAGVQTTVDIEKLKKDIEGMVKEDKDAIS